MLSASSACLPLPALSAKQNALDRSCWQKKDHAYMQSVTSEQQLTVPLCTTTEFVHVLLCRATLTVLHQVYLNVTAVQLLCFAEHLRITTN
jgi:hypothetical protein